VKPADLDRLLREFHAEKRTMRERHEAAARIVRDFNLNNTYQYVIAREEAHLTWLGDAMAGRGVTAPAPEAIQPLAQPEAGGVPAAIFEADAGDAGAFVDRWRDRVSEVTHARHRVMLNVILGETLEHRRFFEQAAAGRPDLLGRRTGGPPLGGDVLAVRWVE